MKADLATFYQVWLGRLPLETALRTGKVRFEGPTALVRRFPGWLKWSPMFDHVRAAMSDARSDRAGQPS